MTTYSSPTETARTPSAHPGPPAAAFAILFLAALFVPALAGVGTMPPPDSGVDTLQTWFASDRAASAAGGLLMLAAVALTVAVAGLCSRLAVVAGSPGLAIASTAGGLAAVTLAGSGAIVAALATSRGPESAEVLTMMTRLSFVLGGPLHTVALGVTVLGLALTSLFSGVTSRRFAVAGLVISGLCGLSALVLVLDVLLPVIPLGRFTAIVWLLVLAARRRR